MKAFDVFLIWIIATCSLFILDFYVFPDTEIIKIEVTTINPTEIKNLTNELKSFDTRPRLQDEFIKDLESSKKQLDKYELGGVYLLSPGFYNFEPNNCTKGTMVFTREQYEDSIGCGGELISPLNKDCDYPPVILLYCGKEKQTDFYYSLTVTYWHELGHLAYYYSSNLTKMRNHKNYLNEKRFLTEYSKTNEEEYFADKYALNKTFRIEVDGKNN